MSSISELVELLDGMRIPIAKLLNLELDFSTELNNMIALLIRGSSENKDEQEKFIDEVTSVIDMLILEGVFATNTKGALIAGKKFQEFQGYLMEYFDMDNTIMRILGISQQDFDNLKREYTAITTGTQEFVGILDAWSDLKPDVKLGIMRGIFIQRGIMANVAKEAAEGFKTINKYSKNMERWLVQWTAPKDSGRT